MGEWRAGRDCGASFHTVEVESQSGEHGDHQRVRVATRRLARDNARDVPPGSVASTLYKKSC
jgi:hypothetical protein